MKSEEVTREVTRRAVSDQMMNGLKSLTVQSATEFQEAALSRTLIANLSTRGRLMATTAILGWFA